MREEPHSPRKAPTDPADAYTRFVARYANSELVRGRRAFEIAVRAAGLDFSQVSDDWLRSLQKDWVYGYTDEPFTDEAANRAYQRLAARLGD